MGFGCKLWTQLIGKWLWFCWGLSCLCRKQASLDFQGSHLGASVPALMPLLKEHPGWTLLEGKFPPKLGFFWGSLSWEPSTARQETPQPLGHFPAQIKSLCLRKSGGWPWLRDVLLRELYSHFTTLVGQLVPQRAAIFHCPYKATNSEATTSFINISWNNNCGDGKVDTASLLMYLHTEKQHSAQNTIHDSSHHLYQPTVMSQNIRQASCPCRAWVSCTSYHCTSYLPQKAFSQVNSQCVLMYCPLKPGL